MHRDSLLQKTRYARLAGAADALLIAHLAHEHAPLAVVTASAQDAPRLLEKLA